MQRAPVSASRRPESRDFGVGYRALRRHRGRCPDDHQSGKLIEIQQFAVSKLL